VKAFLQICSLIFLTLAVHAETFSPKLPKTAKTTEEIIRSFQGQRGNGRPEWARFSGFDRELFVIWNCPFSGRAATFVFAYAHDGSMWTRFYDKLLEGTHQISVQSPRMGGQDGELAIRSWDDKTLATLSLKPLPRLPPK
jgi:hypothetical protein